MKFKPATGILLFTLFFASVSGQEANKKETIKIATSSQCEMCKTRIETAMAYEKGVVKSNLDLETKILTVTYKTGKTTPEQIRKAISMVGYDADDVPADPKAYSELSPCCKKPEDPEHTNH
ncbi:MAG: heavy-metal-associated domain-containing protein [Bacteroidales bacterium]|nr:heavy-metal-associated domain-containing protein [Bacteroidales bacterium]